ncbi:MAG: nucleotidyltransferase domain-containing protein [Verrucomicrobia bacterium]|nr:nucleotidyltransferase domain-containing protein [Verrucomicrobiota bacterium]
MVCRIDIEKLARDIAREFKPERIILFGSYAYGTPSEDSDVDFLIQMPLRDHPAREAVAIRLKVRPKFPTDLLVRSAEQIQQRLQQGDSVLQEIIAHGLVLYENGDN